MSYRPPRRVAHLRSVKRLEDRLRTLDKSGADLAREIGISRQFVSRLRVGRAQGMQVETAEQVEKALDVKPGYLFRFPADERTAVAS